MHAYSCKYLVRPADRK